MSKARVLFVSQEIVPYLKDTPMGHITRYLPQGFRKKEKKSALLCQNTAISMSAVISCMK